MRYNFLIIALISLFITGCCRLYGPNGSPIDPGTGAINVLADPVQCNLTNPQNIVLKAQNTPLLVTPVAGYKIAAEVKSKMKYSWDWSSEIGPYDLALVWGDLTKPDVEKHITYSQGNRWYYFHYDGQCPVSESYIYEHSANTHILPASYNLRSVLDSIQVNQIIYMEGYLVKISGTLNGGNVWWNSSTSRTDRGGGSCEVFYVNKIILNNTVYY